MKLLVDTLEDVPEVSWSYVSSKKNPVDCSLRGLLVYALVWWFWPDWLSQSIKKWPPVKFKGEQILKEMKRSTICYVQTEESFDLANGCFSIFLWLQCVPTWWSTNKLEFTLQKLIKLDQQKHFNSEVRVEKRPLQAVVTKLISFHFT